MSLSCSKNGGTDVISVLSKTLLLMQRAALAASMATINSWKRLGAPLATIYW
jgi:hypothetical protein